MAELSLSLEDVVILELASALSPNTWDARESRRSWIEERHEYTAGECELEYDVPKIPDLADWRLVADEKARGFQNKKDAFLKVWAVESSIFG